MKKIAVIPVKNLGDGLLFMIIAYNLVRNGCWVELFSDLMAQLQEWQPNFKITPYSLIQFTTYDLIIIDGNHPDIKKISAMAPCLVISGSRFNADNIGNDKLPLFNNANGTVMSSLAKDASMAECIKIFCAEKLQLENVTIDNGLTTPSFPRRLESRRIIIHPFSAKPEKNWSLKRFIKLARKLQKEGYEPKFVATAAERKKLGKKVPLELWSPVFSTIDKLAQYLFESSCVIANDSGVGHLASNLDIPVITIAPSRKKNFKWRPGWGGNNIVINPSYAVRLGKKYLWQPFVSVRRVLCTIYQL